MLASNHSRQPLLLTSSKTWVGHAEPAAGINGLLHAAFTVALHVQLPLLHLRTLSPHITQAMHGRGSSSAPRQMGPVAAAAAQQHVGVSSFGFSGSNAHAILSSVHGASLVAAPAGIWHHEPMWCVPQLDPWAMTCLHAESPALLLQGRLPVEVVAALTNAPAHAWQCAWAHVVMRAAQACADATDAMALVNVRSRTGVQLQPKFEIRANMANGEVAVAVGDQTAMTAVLATVERHTDKGAILSMVYTCSQPVALTTASMVETRRATLDYLQLVAACQMMALSGNSLVEVDAVVDRCTATATRHMPTTLAASPNTCAVGPVRVIARSTHAIQHVYKLALKAAAPAAGACKCTVCCLCLKTFHLTQRCWPRARINWHVAACMLPWSCSSLQEKSNNQWMPHALLPTPGQCMACLHALPSNAVCWPTQIPFNTSFISGSQLLRLHPFRALKLCLLAPLSTWHVWSQVLHPLIKKVDKICKLALHWSPVLPDT